MACLAAIFTPVFTLGLGDLPPQLYSHGSSLLGTLQQVAGAFGTAVLVVVMENRPSTWPASGSDPADAFVGGLQWAFVVGAVIGSWWSCCRCCCPRGSRHRRAHPSGTDRPGSSREQNPPTRRQAW